MSRKVTGLATRPANLPADYRPVRAKLQVGLDGQPPAWERQIGESRQAYAAFVVYRDMDPEARAIRRAAEIIGHGNWRRLGEWSSRWSWVVRAQVWDQQQSRIKEDQQREDSRAQITSVREDQATTVKQQLQAARALMRECLRVVQIEQRKADQDGGPDPRNLQLAAQALEKSVAMQRVALGLPTDITRQDYTLRQTTEQALLVQRRVRAIIEEHICDDCRQRVGDELRRLAREQQNLADAIVA